MTQDWDFETGFRGISGLKGQKLADALAADDDQRRAEIEAWSAACLARDNAPGGLWHELELMRAGRKPDADEATRAAGDAAEARLKARNITVAPGALK